MTDYSKIPDNIGELKIGDTYPLVVVGVSDSSVRELAPSEATLSCEIDSVSFDGFTIKGKKSTEDTADTIHAELTVDPEITELMGMDVKVVASSSAN